MRFPNLLISITSRHLAAAGLFLLVLTAGAVMMFAPADDRALWHIAKFVGWAVPTAVATIALRRLRFLTHAHRQAEQTLSARKNTVDHLLDFSQTIQGAGKADQVFPTLAHYLRTELDLTGVAILASDHDALPVTQLKAAWPDTLVKTDHLLNELDACLCPCLRQGLPRHFRADGAPVRCAIDQSLDLSPDHPAYCIPFNIGRKTQVLVHMLVAPGQTWTEQRHQLAQTYVNSAQSLLISLQQLQEAEQQSMTDGLTGLFNRRSMDQLLEREVALAERHGHALSIVMIDVDRFKQINDGHGHAAGDHLLRAFSDCVRITLRKTDLAFRYGGDEFIIALPQTPVAQAQQVVQKLRQAFASVDFSSAIAHLDDQPTLSVGVAERDKAANTLTLPHLLAAADTALYEAKNNNRNCVRIYKAPFAA